MTDSATPCLPDAPDRPAPVRPLVLLPADDAVVCVDDLCIGPDDEAVLSEATASQEAAR